MILTSHALASWLRSLDIEPSEVTLVLRAKTPETETKLARAAASLFVGQASFQTSERQVTYPTARPYHLKLNGVDVLITSLDSSARKADG